jgi:hypothetical protein
MPNNVIVQPEITVVVEVGQQGAKGAAGFMKWTTATRPTVPVVGQSVGYNTDFGGIEVYTNLGWLVLQGSWTFGNRPPELSLAPGSMGYNTELGTSEQWNGEEWKPK